MALVLAGCSGDPAPDDDPVPTTAEAPFICDGVPLRGLELMIGSPDVTYDQVATDGWDGSFRCSVELEDGEHSPSAEVSRFATHGPGFGTPEERIAKFIKERFASPLEASAPGAGYILSSGKDWYALWLCPDWTRTEVALYDAPLTRDSAADLERYMISILPWACGDQDAPSRTVED